MSAIPIDTLRRYQTDPMAYFSDSRIPAEGNPRFGDVWADFQAEAFRVLSECILAVESGRHPPWRGVFLERVKGASKDSDIGLALNHALLFSSRPLTIEVAADDFLQASELRGAMADDIRLNSWKGVLEVQTKRIVHREWASECKFLTRDEFARHGSRPDITVCNELSHIQSEGFASTVLDNATKIPSNLTVIATNAGHLKTWQHRWRELYRQNPRWWFQKVDSRPPWQNAADIEDARARSSPSRFKSLFQGIWTPIGGDAIPAKWIDDAILDGRPLSYRTPNYPAGAIGVDAGLSHHHGAVVVACVDPAAQKVRVMRVWDFPPPVRLSRIAGAIREARRIFQVRAVHADPWQFAGLGQQLEQEGFNVELHYPTSANQNSQATALMEVLRNGQLEIYREHELLVRDLYATQVIDRKSADVTTGYRLAWVEDETGHGDRAAALANILPCCVEALGIPVGPAAEPRVVGRVGGDGMKMWG